METLAPGNGSTGMQTNGHVSPLGPFFGHGSFIPQVEIDQRPQFPHQIRRSVPAIRKELWLLLPRFPLFRNERPREFSSDTVHLVRIIRTRKQKKKCNGTADGARYIRKRRGAVAALSGVTAAQFHRVPNARVRHAGRSFSEPARSSAGE